MKAFQVHKQVRFKSWMRAEFSGLRRCCEDFLHWMFVSRPWSLRNLVSIFGWANLVVEVGCSIWVASLLAKNLWRLQLVIALGELIHLDWTWVTLNLWLVMASSVLIVLLLLWAGRACGQDCTEVRPVHMCNDLCDVSLLDPRVREVHFGGIIASLACIPPSVKVR